MHGSRIGWLRTFAACVVIATGLAARPAAADDTLKIGSKRFTESYVLGALLTETARPTARVEHRQGLGNTAIVFSALESGAIDVYVEYTGTLAREILGRTDEVSIAALDAALAPRGLAVGVPLGFQDTYALAMREDRAQALGVRTIGDLAHAPGLSFGLSHEFLGRADGWPGVAQRYGLPQAPVGLDHGLAYRAVAQGRIDVIDVYTTDAEIARTRLRVLDDDRHFFPRYDAVLVYRRDVPQRFPKAWEALRALEGRIDTHAMIAMNAAAAIDGMPFDAIARRFVAGGTTDAAVVAPTTRRTRFTRAVFDKTFDDRFWGLTRQHVALVAISTLAAAVIGIALGIVAARWPRLRAFTLAATGVLQTVPSLALLAMLIPLVGGIGALPASIALFVYALLPIVRNTCVGLLEVPQGLRDAGRALGLRDRTILTAIELPLARPTLLAGIETAAVTNVGTATIAAFIGAGGYGERIATGLALDDHALLLAGALPAAALALIVQALFAVLARIVRVRTKETGADR